MGLPEKLGKVGVIFDSGAFYGAFGLGFAKALWGRGIRPAAIGGVSVGALNAAKLAEKNSLSGIRELEDIWLEVQKTGPGAVFNKWDAIKNRLSWHSDPTSIYGSTQLEHLVHKIDAEKAVSSDTLLQLVVSDELNDSPKIISNRDDEVRRQPLLIHDYIRASASVAGAFPPVIIRDGVYRDGVYSDGLVFWPLLESFADFGCDTIFVALNDQKQDPSYTHEAWDIRLFRTLRRMQIVDNKNGIQEFLEKHPDFHPFDYEVEKDDPPIFKGLKKIKNWLTTTIVEGNFDGIRHQLVVTFPHCCIPNFYPTKFKGNEICVASQKNFEETNRILDKLEKQ